MTFIGGALLTLIGLKGAYFPDLSIPLINEVVRDVGPWISWIAVIGPLLLIGGGWVLGDGILKRKEFNRLIGTTSKSAFVRNLDRLEQLAWLLSADHEEKVWERKRHFHVK